MGFLGTELHQDDMFIEILYDSLREQAQRTQNAHGHTSK
jgi:hypothetical protein